MLRIRQSRPHLDGWLLSKDGRSRDPPLPSLLLGRHTHQRLDHHRRNRLRREQLNRLRSRINHPQNNRGACSTHEPRIFVFREARQSGRNPLAEPAGVLHETHAPAIYSSESRPPRDATAYCSRCASDRHFMITSDKLKSAENALATVAKCANEVLAALFGTSEESRFEKAMEIALRLEGLTIELQRIVPVTYRGCALRDVRDELDIVVWVQGESNDTPKIGIVIELKVDAAPDAKWQVMRYIKSLSSALPPKHGVYHKGLLRKG